MKVSIEVTPKQGLMLGKLANVTAPGTLEDVDEILYGGQAGGGKSECLLLFFLLRRLTCPGSIGIVFRRTVKDLEKSLIRKTKIRWAKYSDYAKWNEEKKCWIFKNGSIQEFGYIEHDNDLMNYDSAEYDDIGFDQLEHFPQEHYSYMKSRLRSMSGGNWKTLMRSSCNPGKIGHQWIKEYFVLPARERIHEEWDEDLKRFKTRYFLPASLDDNTLMAPEKRAEYRSWLKQLPEADRERLMNGNWDYNPGAAFKELERRTHGVKEDLPVPEWATILCSFDYGFGKPFSIGWWWIDYDGRMWRFNEWYGWNGKKNEGLRLPASEIAKGILERETAWKIKPNRIIRYSNPDIFSKTPDIRGGGQGPSVAEIMAEHGVVWNAGDPNRFLGKQQFHERLKVPENGSLPMAMFYESCYHFWRTVPNLQEEEGNKEDVDNKTANIEDHVYEECKMAVMSRPISPTVKKPEETYMQKLIKGIQKPRGADYYDLPAEIYDY